MRVVDSVAVHQLRWSGVQRVIVAAPQTASITGRQDAAAPRSVCCTALRCRRVGRFRPTRLRGHCTVPVATATHSLTPRRHRLARSAETCSSPPWNTRFQPLVHRPDDRASAQRRSWGRRLCSPRQWLARRCQSTPPSRRGHAMQHRSVGAERTARVPVV